MELSTPNLLMLSAAFGLLCVPIARKTAVKLKLVDNPNIRKRHVGNVPLAGGVVLLVGLWVFAGLIPKSMATWSVFALALPLFLMGAIDDKFDLSAKLRILIQVAVGLALVVIFNVSILQLDGVFSNTPVSLGWGISTIFTVMCACGVLNAINMADGIDGLLGSLSSISLIALAALALKSGYTPEAHLALLVVGLLVGYLAFNLGLFGSDKRIFLGDSGSMLVGLVLLVLLIELSQGNENTAISPTSAGWLLGVPLLDTVSVMVRRVVAGRSPFSAGRDHFHHVLQDLGLSRTRTLQLMIFLQLIFVGIGVFSNLSTFPQFLFFWLFVFTTVAQYAGISFAVKAIGNGYLSERGIEVN